MRVNLQPLARNWSYASVVMLEDTHQSSESSGTFSMSRKGKSAIEPFVACRMQRLHQQMQGMWLKALSEAGNRDPWSVVAELYATGKHGS
jgi:hypothetical protein